ncbi:MAG: transcription-repair coupling factor [bacterium]|nr:transcription-repair coupling factor [bacterium]
MQTILARLQEGNHTPVDISGCSSASAALLLARLLEANKQSICCFLPSEEEMQVLAQDFSFFSSAPLLQFPDIGIPPYTVLKPEAAAVSARISTLYQLQEIDEPTLVLTTIEAVCRRLPAPQRLHDQIELVQAGEETDRDAFIAAAIHSGYHLCDLVRQEGDIALRGGIIDIYPPAWQGESPGPLRLDFFGDTVDSIRAFDPLSQRSSAELNEVILLPATEFLYPRSQEDRIDMLSSFDDLREETGCSGDEDKGVREQLKLVQRFAGLDMLAPVLTGGPASMRSFFEYLPERSALMLVNAPACKRRLDDLYERIFSNFAEIQAQCRTVSPPQDLFLSEEQAHAALSTGVLARLSRLPDPDAQTELLTFPAKDHALLAQEIALSRQKKGMLAPLSTRITEWQQQGETTILACRSARQAAHLQAMLSRHQVEVVTAEQSYAQSRPPEKGSVTCFAQPLSQGFDLPAEYLHILSTAELFGDKRLSPRRRSKGADADSPPVRLDELHQGDVVVHSDHGIALFQGLVNLEFSGIQGDFLLLLFRNDDKLYVPVDKLHKVSKYQGLSEQEPRLDVLGSQRWLYTKQKVSDAVWKVAQELLDIYAKRALRQGHRFTRPGEFYRELEESFPYDETSGQLKAIDEVVEDLCKDQPMDRLVCGDVGYGKTEVAARAAFKVIEDGFQVAILVPTTVLAEQHAVTFHERFATFPVRIACLNRFRTRPEQKQIIGDLAAGKIDIVIGTHRLLSKDIVYNKLGLLVVDEEHRFGVAHKEKIKKIKASVDVLTLTATPIPRTLQMSLLGIRDLSIISTPPKQRRPVKTLLARRDALIIKEACQRELERRGQIFYLHNRVQSIMQAAARIADLVPQARVGVAHGQMPAAELEEAMVRFIRHELDILVCTTIVESGLDITNANTILIDRADRLGLADLYQLRGRVGRGDRQAYAYLLVPSLDHMTDDAERRLQALLDHSDLGDGFQVAMNDLQIRGGGNLLGISQSGHIAAVGYDLYLQLLQETVADLQAQQGQGDEHQREQIFEPEIKLHGAAFFPESYINDTGLRYQAYRKLSYAGNGRAEELAALAEELTDRFGPLPAPAQALFATIAIKQRLIRLRIKRLEQGPQTLLICFDESTPVDPERILGYVQQENTGKKKGQLSRFTPEGHLIIPFTDKGGILTLIDKILYALERS